jgi:hypothetical protein
MSANLSLRQDKNETFGTSFAPWFDDRNIPYGCFKPMNVTHLPDYIASTVRKSRRTDAVGLVTDATYIQGLGDDEEMQRNKSRWTFTLSGRFCTEYYIPVTVWGEQAINLAAKYGTAESGSLIVFIKNAGVFLSDRGQEPGIELTTEYNTFLTFVEVSDQRVLNSDLNIDADKNAELSALPNDIDKDGQRFVEEVFVYADRIQTHPLEAIKQRPGANTGKASAAASPVQARFLPKPKQPLFPLDDDDDDDFAQPVQRSVQKNSNQDTTVGESKSEGTKVANNESTKNDPLLKDIIDSDDDEEEVLHPIASPQKPKSKVTETLSQPQKANPTARATQKTMRRKDAVDTDVDNDDDVDFSRVQRRRKT